MIKHSSKRWGNARRNKATILNEALCNIYVVTKSLGFLRTFSNAGAACNASFLINICLAFLHADSFHRTTPEASIAVPAAGGKGEYYRFFYFFRHFAQPLP